MVEGVYRDWSALEREQLRQWAKQRLTDKLHLKRVEIGFSRTRGEAADKANVRGDHGRCFVNVRRCVSRAVFRASAIREHLDMLIESLGGR